MYDKSLSLSLSLSLSRSLARSLAEHEYPDEQEMYTRMVKEVNKPNFVAKDRI